MCHLASVLPYFFWHIGGKYDGIHFPAFLLVGSAQMIHLDPFHITAITQIMIEPPQNHRELAYSVSDKLLHTLYEYYLFNEDLLGTPGYVLGFVN